MKTPDSSDESSSSEEEASVKKPTVLNTIGKTPDSSDESSSEDSSSEDNSEDEHTKQSITLKNIKKEPSSSSESSSGDVSDTDSSDSESSNSSESSNKSAQNKFKKIPTIKEEPVSDVEERKFKKPSTDFRRNLNASQTSDKSQKRRRTTSVTEQLDSLINQVMGSKGKDKRKSVPAKRSILNNESMDIGNLSTFQSPALSSTLKPTSSKLKRPKVELISPSKIKHESDSEADNGKTRRNAKTGKSK